MAEDGASQGYCKRGVSLSWRPFLLSLPLAFAAAYWMARRVADGVMALSVPPLAFLFALVLFNVFLSRWAKRFALSPLIWEPFGQFYPS